MNALKQKNKASFVKFLIQCWWSQVNYKICFACFEMRGLFKCFCVCVCVYVCRQVCWCVCVNQKWKISSGLGGQQMTNEILSLSLTINNLKPRRLGVQSKKISLPDVFCTNLMHMPAWIDGCVYVYSFNICVLRYKPQLFELGDNDW